MSSEKVTETQTALSEKLQPFHEMHYSEPDGVDMPPQLSVLVATSPSARQTHGADIRPLDFIAICLTTGRAGDVVAAAFDKTAGLRLILAKNGQPTAQDVATTKAFLASLTSVVNWAAMMSFVFRRSKDDVIHRVSQLHRSLSTFPPHLTKSSNGRKNPFGQRIP